VFKRTMLVGSAWLFLCLSLVGSAYGFAVPEQPQATAASQQPSDAIDELRKALGDLQERYVKLEETVSFVSQTHPPVGTVVAFAGAPDGIPDDWMPCDGRPLSRKDYKDLFSKLTVAGVPVWGKGDGITTFNLPNLQGLFLRGVEGGSGPDPDKNRAIGSRQPFATALPQTTQFQTDTFPNHVHPHLFETQAGRQNGGLGTVAPAPRGPDQNTGPAGAHSHKVVAGGDTETRPVNAAIVWIIKVR
jgi:microcystin-dependent protein